MRARIPRRARRRRPAHGRSRARSAADDERPAPTADSRRARSSCRRPACPLRVHRPRHAGDIAEPARSRERGRRCSASSGISRVSPISQACTRRTASSFGRERRGDPFLDRHRQHETVVVIGVLANQIDAARAQRRCPPGHAGRPGKRLTRARHRIVAEMQAARPDGTASVDRSCRARVPVRVPSPAPRSRGGSTALRSRAEVESPTACRDLGRMSWLRQTMVGGAEVVLPCKERKPRVLCRYDSGTAGRDAAHAEAHPSRLSAPAGLRRRPHVRRCRVARRRRRRQRAAGDGHALRRGRPGAGRRKNAWPRPAACCSTSAVSTRSSAR